MSSFKFIYALGALWVLQLVSFQTASAVECLECRGDSLIEAIDDVVFKSQCWFKPEHHFLLDFKMAVLNEIYHILENLYDSTNSKSEVKCRHDLEINCPSTTVGHSLMECETNHMKTLARAYRDLELCNGKSNDPINLELVKKAIIAGVVILGQVHSCCGCPDGDCCFLKRE
uniref:Protein sleepless n=1 Tax=Stomoxys calcitrans TaxID=35570 RepID=A0A1I8PBG9_STOCA